MQRARTTQNNLEQPRNNSSQVEYNLKNDARRKIISSEKLENRNVSLNFVLWLSILCVSYLNWNIKNDASTTSSVCSSLTLSWWRPLSMDWFLRKSMDSANQWTGFYMITTSVMNELNEEKLIKLKAEIWYSLMESWRKRLMKKDINNLAC